MGIKSGECQYGLWPINSKASVDGITQQARTQSTFDISLLPADDDELKTSLSSFD